MDKTKMAIELFDKKANEYQAKYMNVDLYRASLDMFCENIANPKAAILEIACGPGNITKYLLDKCPNFKIIGTDLAPNMIELAKENNPDATFKIMDARDIHQFDTVFDAIICSFGLPYLSKEEALDLISNAARLLRKDGLLYLSTMEDDYSKSGIQTSSTGEQLYMYFHQADYLVAALEANHFEILSIKRQCFPSEEDVKNIDLLLLAKKLVDE